MSKQLGSFKTTRASGDASMLTELRRRATQSLDYNQKITNVSKPIFSYSIPTLFAGPPALFTIARIDNPQFTSFEEGGTTPPTPTYQITESVSSVEEGAAVVFTVTTTNVPDGTTLYWENIGTTTANDFSDNQNDGTITITSNSGSITRTLLLDVVPAETETIILQLRTESLTGTIVATSGTVSVVDKTAVYAVSEDTTSVDEGSSVTFTITTTNVADGTTLYWVTTGTAAAADFTDNVVSGSFTITSGSGTVVRSIVADVTTEGPQTFTLEVRTGSIAGPTVATSSEITINDTSTAILYTWTQQAGAPSQSYQELDVTADFTTQIATTKQPTVGLRGAFVSINSGATWSQSVSGMTFGTSETTRDVAIARSNANTMYVVNGFGTGGNIYKSTDGGSNWISVAPAAGVWNTIECSSDGQIVLAGSTNSVSATFSNRPAVSYDGGSNWTAITTAGSSPSFTAMSLDGVKMYVTQATGSTLYRSSNSGSNWTSTPSLSNIQSLACSADGSIVIIGRGSSLPPIISSNSGVSFTSVSGLSNVAWRFAMSDNGNVISAVQNLSAYISINGGTTWFEQTNLSAITWASTAMDSNGSNIIVGPGANKPYVGVAP